jgi:ABC-type dipeptide/oligopeptide/nickel transport system ATPase component
MSAGGKNTRLILADEPTSALDQLIRRDAADFIMTVKERLGAALLLVTHDLRLAGQISDVIGVMYRGRMVEWGLRQEILKEAVHPYTRSLIRAIPTRDSDFRDYERYSGEIDERAARIPVTETHWVLES